MAGWLAHTQSLCALIKKLRISKEYWINPSSLLYSLLTMPPTSLLTTHTERAQVPTFQRIKTHSKILNDAALNTLYLMMMHCKKSIWNKTNFPIEHGVVSMRLHFAYFRNRGQKKVCGFLQCVSYFQSAALTIFVQSERRSEQGREGHFAMPFVTISF